MEKRIFNKHPIQNPIKKGFQKSYSKARNEIYIDGFPIDYTKINTKDSLNADVFCTKDANIYDNEFYEKAKSIIFFSKNQENINKYKLCCQPRNVTISAIKLDEFTNQLWKDKRYEDLFRFFKQFKSLQSSILLDCPRDEHITAKFSNEFLNAISVKPNETTSKNIKKDKTITFPCLNYNADLWLNFCLAFYPTFKLNREFFTFDVLRTLLVIWQQSLLTCFQDLYEKYRKESESNTKNDDNGLIKFITETSKAKKEYVYDKGLNVAKQIYNLFCKNPLNYNIKDNDLGIEFSICYIESLEQYDRTPGMDGWIIKRLYHEIQGHRKIKKFEDVEIEIANIDENIWNKPEFNILVATLIPYHDILTFDEWFSKCDRIHSTKDDYIKLFNQKLTESDKKRISDFKSLDEESKPNISDIILRTFRIKALMNNEIYIHNKSFKDFFIDNIFTASYLQTVSTMPKLTIMDALFANDTLNVGTKFTLPFFKEFSKDYKMTISDTTLDLMDKDKIFNSLINNMLIVTDYNKLKIVFNNIIYKYSKEGFVEFINKLISYGDNVLKLENAYKEKFTNTNQTSYCKMIGGIIYLKAFSINQVKTILSQSFEERILVSLYLVEHRNDNTMMFEKHLSNIIKEAIKDIDDTKITRNAKYALIDINEALCAKQ